MSRVPTNSGSGNERLRSTEQGGYMKINNELRSHNLPRSATQVYYTLVDHVRDAPDQTCWLSSQTIALESGLPIRSVENGVRTLKQHELVVTSKHPSGVNQYTLLEVKWWAGSTKIGGAYPPKLVGRIHQNWWMAPTKIGG